MVVDPVCKMEVEDTDAAQSVEFQGTDYFFCSPTCKEAFEREPTKYVKTAETPLDPEAAA
jgi:YHS domain-containing protein